MENFSRAIANKIANELKLDNDNKEVIAYGIFALLDIIVSIILVGIIGALFHVLIEALIISFTIGILRKYSGGVHASSPISCTTIGTVICIGQALLITFVISSSINFKLISILGLICFTWSYYMINKLAPIDSASKPIKSPEKRKRMKKKSIIILIIYLVIEILDSFLYIYTKNGKIKIYMLCIYGGVAWQIFTLTNLGHLIISNIDYLFNKVLNTIRRRK